MSFPKYILPRIISSASGSFVLDEGVIGNLLLLEAAASHERRWRTVRVSREWLIV